MTDTIRHMVPAAEPTASQPGVFLCQYCGTECADVQARDGHEALCDHNPALGLVYTRAEEARAALAAKSKEQS